MAIGEVQLVKVVEGMDVDLGKVEIVDSAGINTADVNDANTSRGTGTHVLAVQHIDAAGAVLAANPVLGSGANVIGQVNASQVTSPWICNASLVTGSNVTGKLAANSGTDIGDVDLGSLISGEDQTNDVMKVEGQFTYANVTASGATVVKSAAGFLHSITFNTAASGVTTVVYDASGVGTIIGTVLPAPSAVAQGAPFTLLYDVKCLSGITCSQVSGAATGSNLTVSYR